MSARCRICDWSPSNLKSLYNPSIEEIGYNKLYIDGKTTETLCIHCIDSIYTANGAYLKGFKEIQHDDRRSTGRARDEDTGTVHWSDLPEYETV